METKTSIENFTPEVITEGRHTYGLVLVEIAKCPTCDHFMLKGDLERLEGFTPYWEKVTITVQAERAGWRWWSWQRNSEGRHICQTCASEGKATFRCSLCKQERSSSQKHTSIGHPDGADHLCAVCYETVPAKKWQEKYDALSDEHRWDWD
jgi:hypothetical protein